MVVFDLILAFTFWIGLLILAPFNRMTTREIEKKRLAPTDFTVQLHAVRPTDDADQLNVIYWAWAQNILDNSSTSLDDPETNMPDCQ